MEVLLFLKKQQYLVLLLFLLVYSNILATAHSKAQIQPLHIPNVKETSNNGPERFQLAYADDHIALFFEPADNEIISQFVFTPVAESDRWKFQDKCNRSTSTGTDLPIVYVISHGPTQRNSKNELNSELYSTNETIYSEHDIDKIRSDDTNVQKPANDHNLTTFKQSKSKVQAEAKALKASLTRVYEQEIKLILKWRILDILVYDNLLLMGNTMIAQGFLEEVINKTTNFPIKNTTLFSGWYLPIYKNYGGRKSIRNFMNLLKLYLNNNNGSNYFSNATMNTGEFIHIWSEATSTDLRELAYNVFGWSPQHSTQFQAARKSFTTKNYSDVSRNLSLYTPPPFWNNTWKGTTKNLTRVHLDEHVAFYYEESVPASVTWPHQLLSDSWRYSKSTYGFVGPDPYLYVFLRTGKESYCLPSYSESSYYHRIAIDCQRVSAHDWNEESDFNLGELVYSLAHIVALTVGKIENMPPQFQVKKHILCDILIYDIYLGVGKTTYAERWRKQKQMQDYHYPRRYTFWFRDWFLPIYTKYGGSMVLKGFLTSLCLHWPQVSGTGLKMNDGEFVHYWSGAAGADLTSLAMQTFGFGVQNSNELVQARIDYSQLNHLYSPVNSTAPQKWKDNWKPNEVKYNLVYSNDHVAFYFDSDAISQISWLFSLMSDSWMYAKKTYGPLSYDKSLYIILQRKSFGCRTSKFSSYFDAAYGNRNVIDCRHGSAPAWNFMSLNYKDVLFKHLGNVILRNARETGTWPGFKTSHSSMQDILVYDLYKGLGMMKDAERWRKKMFVQSEIFSGQNTFCFRDWYYPIYVNYNTTDAINAFLSVVKANWPQRDHNYIGKYNMGEMVHFWSMAVNENLWSLADKAFGCCTWDQKTYLKARKDFSNFNYDAASTVIIPPENWIDPENKNEQHLKLIYVDYYIAVYSETNVFDTRSLQPVSDAWRYTKRTYGPFEPNAILYLVLLQESAEDGCTTSRQFSYHDDNRTVVTCGKFVATKTWNNELQQIIEQLGFIVLQEAKQTGNWPAYGLSLKVMGHIVAFDISNGIRRPHQAYHYLRKVIEFSIDVPQNDTFWTREWFYPIYSKYGQAQVINTFLNLLSEHWQKQQIDSAGFDYVKQLNVGEFVHFWSGAAGVNLKFLANRTFQWNHEHSILLDNAIVAFPMITYSDLKDMVEPDSAPHLVTEDQFGHSELLLKAYGGSKITIYFDADINITIKWPISLISKTWNQTKSNYATVQNTLDPKLKVFLHGAKHMGCETYLQLPNNTDLESVLDCGKDPSTADAWASDSPENRDTLINGFSKLIQHSAKQTEKKEAYEAKPFSEMLVFDIFLRLGNFEDAHRLLNKTFNENEIESGGGKFWSCDWFLPLYIKYGGVALLDKFVFLLSNDWVEGRHSVNKKMNVGQNIHFWSGAAGKNLNAFAQNIFGRNQKHQDQFSQAKMDYPSLQYTCDDCPISVNGTQIQIAETPALDNVVLASIVLVCIAIAAAVTPWLFYRRKLKKLQEQMRELSTQEIKEFFEGSDTVKDNNNMNLFIESKPFNVDYEIQRERLNIVNIVKDFERVLGSGEFGVVFRGMLTPITRPGEESFGTLVAVKTAKPNVNVTHFKTILTELKIMGFLGSHSNIVSLLGACTVNIRSREVFIALEFCSQGDLLSFLKSNRACLQDSLIQVSKETTEMKLYVGSRVSYLSFSSETRVEVADNGEFSARIVQDVNETTFITPKENESPTTFCCGQSLNKSLDTLSTFQLLDWSHQIASGMDYIASKNVIHGDLAARNVLLTAENVAKISDFGLSRQLAKYSTYMKTSKTPLPWRWMAIESLRDMNFSVRSDAWSFGVVLYEIFTLGTIPYAGWTWDYKFVDKLVAGHRLSAPELGNEDIYNLMMDCMQKEPSERTTFSQIICRLEEIKVKISSDATLDASSKYIELGKIEV